VGVALFSGGNGDGKTVLFWGQRAGGVGRVGAGRIFKLVEVELEDAGAGEAVVGQAGVQETRGFIGGGLAGLISEDEEKNALIFAFDDGLEVEGFAVEGELGYAGRGQVEGVADDGGDLLSVRRVVGNPSGGDAKVRVGRIPVEAVEGGAGGGISVFDAQGVAAPRCRTTMVRPCQAMVLGLASSAARRPSRAGAPSMVRSGGKPPVGARIWRDLALTVSRPMWSGAWARMRIWLSAAEPTVLTPGLSHSRPMRVSQPSGEEIFASR
jgi:hypothetical protein